MLSVVTLQISKLQAEIDSEAEHRAELARSIRGMVDKKMKSAIEAKIEKSDEKLDSMTVLMLHYCAGLQHCLDQEEVERQKHAEVSVCDVDSDTLPNDKVAHEEDVVGECDNDESAVDEDTMRITEIAKSEDDLLLDPVTDCLVDELLNTENFDEVTEVAQQTSYDLNNENDCNRALVDDSS